MVMYVFWITLALELLYVLLFALTIKYPSFRFWPPPSARSWQFFAAWIIVLIVALNFLLLGLLDFDSFILPDFRSRLPFALALFVVGSAIGTWAFVSFTLRTTIGLGDKLITRGAYKYSRNPQYVGDSLNIVGYVVLTNSWRVAVVGVLGVVLNLMAPFTEEPWLEARFGEAYVAYKRRVPRFIGRRNELEEL